VTKENDGARVDLRACTSSSLQSTGLVDGEAPEAWLAQRKKLYAIKWMAIMNTLLVTTQIVAYGVGIVSASLNIAVFMRRHRARCRRLHAVRPRAQ
jgi:hypothetical protein